MAKVIILSRHFLKDHPKEGQPTYFVESVYKSLFLMKVIPHEIEKTYSNERFLNGYSKHHTIRFGRRWETGDTASLRIWSDKPYRSKQIAIAPDVTLRVVDIVVDYNRGVIGVKNGLYQHSYDVLCSLSVDCSDLQLIAQNDGLSPQDFLDWFQVGKKKGVHEAQILIWGNIEEY